MLYINDTAYAFTHAYRPNIFQGEDVVGENVDWSKRIH